MKLRSLLIVSLGSAFISIAIYLWMRLALSLAWPIVLWPGVFLFPGQYLMSHILPYPYLVMSCPGCEPAHKELVVSVVWLVLNVAFWTTAIFIGNVLFRFIRRLFPRASSNQVMERTATRSGSRMNYEG